MIVRVFVLLHNFVTPYTALVPTELNQSNYLIYNDLRFSNSIFDRVGILNVRISVPANHVWAHNEFIVDPSLRTRSPARKRELTSWLL